MPRILEILAATVALIVLAPVIVVLLIVSAVVLRASPVFSQERLGLDERPFTIYKIRTLPTTVSSATDKYHLRDVPVPRVCRTMRRLHLDELPQLFNVVVGSMSIVGPRPEMPFLAAEMSDAQRAARRSTRPGLTGLWQISVDARGLIHEHPEYDIEYSRRRSLSTDVRIIIRTVGTISSRSALMSRAEFAEVCGGARVALFRSTAGEAAGLEVG